MLNECFICGFDKHNHQAAWALYWAKQKRQREVSHLHTQGIEHQIAH